MGWYPFDAGSTIGQRGPENGIVLLDEEHDLGARITLDRDGDTASFAITCGIYGWMFHTRFFASLDEAKGELARMQERLAAILEMVPTIDDPEADAKSRQVCDAIGDFVAEFP